MIRAIIIDDEYTARAALRQELEACSSMIEIIDEADGCESGIEAVNRLRPDLLFLDIHLGDGDAFRLLESLQWKQYKVIFTTAYEQYAIKALRLSAVDYILKPVQASELVEALQKVNTDNHQSRQSLLIDILFYNNRNVQEKRIAFNTTDGVSLHFVRDILYCMAESNYTFIYFAGDKKLLTAKPLKEIEEMLDGLGFTRVHQSYLVNLAHVTKYQVKNNGMLVMSNGTSIPLSQRKKSFVLDLLNQHRSGNSE